MLVDSHTHISNYGPMLPDVLAAAQAAGVGHIVLCGMDLSDSRAALAVAEAHPGLLSAAAGWHPWLIRSALDPQTYADYRQLILDHPEQIRMVGEIGLDYSETYVGTRQAQREVFRAFVRLAGELNLPMTIHVRGSAHDDTVELLSAEETPSLKGAIHGFDGSAADAQRYLDLGLLIAAGRGMLTGPESLQQVFRDLPIERLVVETDASYRPDREVNPTPALVHEVAQKLADVKGLTFEEVEHHTTRSFETLLGSPLASS